MPKKLKQPGLVAGKGYVIKKPQNDHHQQHSQSPEKNGEKPDLLLVGRWTPFMPHALNLLQQSMSCKEKFQARSRVNSGAMTRAGR
jgi:hypothetical protein